MNVFSTLRYFKKRIIGCSLFILLIHIFMCYGLIKTNPGYNLSIFDLIINPMGAGMLNYKIVAFPIVIIFIFWIISILDLDDSKNIILRQESKERYWLNQIKKIISISFLYSVFITIETYVISGIMLGSFSNNWERSDSTVFQCYGDTELWGRIVPYLKTWIILSTIFVLLFVGLIAIGMLIGALKMYLDSKYVYLILIIIVLCEVVISGFYFIIKRMALSVGDFIEPQIIILKVLFLTVLEILAFIIGKGYVVKRDFFTKK